MVSDGRCATCKWWQGKDEFRKGWRYCELASSWDAEPLHEEALAFGVHAPDARVGVVTSPDFGCVQWEAKDDPHRLQPGWTNDAK